MEDLKELESMPPRGGRGDRLCLEKMAMLHGIDRGLTASRIEEQTVSDMNAAVDYMRGLSGIRPDRAGVIGFCRGGLAESAPEGVGCQPGSDSRPQGQKTVRPAGFGQAP